MSTADVVPPNKLTLGLRNFSVLRLVLYLLALAGATVDLTFLASNDDLHRHPRFYSLLIIQSSLVALRSIFAIAVSVLVFHAVDNFHWKDESQMRLWAKVLLVLLLISVAQMAAVETVLSPHNANSSIQQRHFYVDFGLALFDVTYLFIVYCFNEDVHNGTIVPSFD